jgi:hypothetical protein
MGILYAATEYGAKKRAGAVATPLRAAIQSPRPFWGSGVATARAFSDFAAPSPALPESGSAADLNQTLDKENLLMPLIPKVEVKQAKKIVSARLDEETHSMLQRYSVFLGEATHDYIISESLKRLFKRDREFKEWRDKNDSRFTTGRESKQQERLPVNTTA